VPSGEIDVHGVNILISSDNVQTSESVVGDDKDKVEMRCIKREE
jgi:hypothetical protein